MARTKKAQSPANWFKLEDVFLIYFEKDQTLQVQQSTSLLTATSFQPKIIINNQCSMLRSHPSEQYTAIDELYNEYAFVEDPMNQKKHNPSRVESPSRWNSHEKKECKLTESSLSRKRPPCVFSPDWLGRSMLETHTLINFYI
jgi:hypothetical protein